MALERIRIRTQLTLNQQNELYNDFLKLEAMVVGYKELCKQEGITEKSALYLDNFMKTITYKTLKEKIKEMKK